MPRQKSGSYTHTHTLFLAFSCSTLHFFHAPPKLISRPIFSFYSFCSAVQENRNERKKQVIIGVACKCDDVSNVFGIKTNFMACTKYCLRIKKKANAGLICNFDWRVNVCVCVCVFLSPFLRIITLDTFLLFRLIVCLSGKLS